jgi:hypothetical protein
LQVLQRLDGEQHVAVRVEAVDERRDLVVRRSAGEPPIDRMASIAIASDAVLVSITRTLSPNLLGGEVGALERAGQRRRDVQ